MWNNNKIIIFILVWMVLLWGVLIFIANNPNEKSISNNNSNSNSVSTITWNIEISEQNDEIDILWDNEPLESKVELSNEIESNCENSENVEFCIDSEINKYLSIWSWNSCDNIDDKYKKRCSEIVKLNKDIEIQTQEFKKSLKEEKKSSDQEYLDQAISTNDKSICDKIQDAWLKDFCKMF